MVVELPASITGNNSISSVMLSVSVPVHGGFASVVNVIITPPLAISALLGIYVGLKVAELVKDPVPLDDHVNELELEVAAPIIV